MYHTSSRTLAVLVLAALLGGFAPAGSGFAVSDASVVDGQPGSGDADRNHVGTPATPEPSGPVAVTRKAGVEIRFTCDSVRVSVPDDVGYSLVVHYFVAPTGEYDRGIVGPLEGTVEEPFDDEIVFFEVNVLVGSTVVASGFIPESCPNTPGLTLGGPESALPALLVPPGGNNP